MMRNPKLGLAGCLLLLSFPFGASAGAAGQSRAMCRSWVGRYSGALSEEQNPLQQAEKVSVIIVDGSIVVQIWGDDGAGFLGSANLKSCSRDSLRSILDTGAEGNGKISLSLSRKGGIHLRLFGYKEGIGPNKAGYLPPEKLEVPLHKMK